MDIESFIDVKSIIQIALFMVRRWREEVRLLASR